MSFALWKKVLNKSGNCESTYVVQGIARKLLFVLQEPSTAIGPTAPEPQKLRKDSPGKFKAWMDKIKNERENAHREIKWSIQDTGKDMASQ